VVQANVFDPDFEEHGVPGFSGRRARVGRQAGGQRLGASVYEVPPGQATWPYHWHTANEELLIVLSGKPSLRTPEGWRELAAGEVVAFPVGEKGAHQLVNRSEEPARVLLVSEMNAPEVSVYPDSGKLAAFDTAPGSADEGLEGIFRLDDAIDYWEGEEPPRGGEGRDAPGR
jgi:uncharacterized cupin superfamily protein